jgi:beta-lactamase regulating signal transducer with metallopeptidase domain
MSWLLQTTLANTLIAAMLALAALGVSKFFRRPAVSHALWLLVLLKLITPPLVVIPLHFLPAPIESTHTPIPMPAAQTKERVTAVEVASVDTIYEEQPYIEDVQPRPMAASPAPQPLKRSIDLTTVVAGLWLSGSGLCLIIVITRLRQFSRLLRFSEVAPAQIQQLAHTLASRLNLSHSPIVQFIPGPLCPMLWCLAGRAKLLIPSALWDRLNDHQRQTLLLHELAHYRRGDHFIRLLELLITIVYWWNPIAWWARHELREAEEQCCDAWVIWALPHSTRTYASALMEAIDFVSTTRQAVPILASPMGEFHDLKRRMLMLKQHELAPPEKSPRSLGWGAFGLICGVGALLLTLSTSLAQQEKPREAGAPAGLPPLGPAVQEGVTDVEVQPKAGVGAGSPYGIAVDNVVGKSEAAALQDDLEQTQAEISKLTERLKRARTRLAELERRAGPVPIQGDIAAGMATAPAPAVPRGRGGASASVGPAPGMTRYNGIPAGTNNNFDQERRLRNVEQKLDMLIEELHAMNPDRERKPDAAGGPARR